MTSVKKPKTRKPYDHFKETVRGYFVGGIVLLLLGVGIMVGSWPSTEVYGAGLLSEPVVSESGSSFGVFLGAVLATAGQIFVAVAIIACGVRLGNTPRATTPVS